MPESELRLTDISVSVAPGRIQIETCAHRYPAAVTDWFAIDGAVTTCDDSGADIEMGADIGSSDSVLVIDGREDLVAALEELTAAARAGEIVSIAVATVRADGTIRTQWEHGRAGNVISLLAGAAHLQHRIHTEASEDIDDGP